MLAIAIAIMPAAIVRAVSPSTDRTRHAIATLSAIPLALAALLVGATTEQAGTTPTRLVDDLTADLPAGPGVFVATRAPVVSRSPVRIRDRGRPPRSHARPSAAPHEADVIVADTIRANQIAAADAAAFGRLDVKRVIPRGRGFQLIGDLPDHGEPVLRRRTTRLSSAPRNPRCSRSSAHATKPPPVASTPPRAPRA